MIRFLTIVLVWLGIVTGQSSLDILNTPTDTRDAALGINLNPIVKPTRVMTHPEQVVTLNVWNWVADIQGAYIGVGLDHTYLSVQAINSGELEYRNDIPTEDPISTFGYTLFNVSAAHAKKWQRLSVGLGVELIYERTLNASASGISLNLAAAYELNDRYHISGGLRHLGITGKLDQERTALPTELWSELDATFKSFSILSELNSGPIPLAIGFTYPLLNSFELMAGLQAESTDPSLSIHPSLGFTVALSNFTLGYSIYQMDLPLGPRHFFTLYWDYSHDSY